MVSPGCKLGTRSLPQPSGWMAGVWSRWRSPGPWTCFAPSGQVIGLVGPFPGRCPSLRCSGPCGACWCSPPAWVREGAPTAWARNRMRRTCDGRAMKGPLALRVHREVMQTFQVRRGTPGTEPSVASPPGTLARQRWAGRWKPFGLGVGYARPGAAVPRKVWEMDPSEDRAMFLVAVQGNREGTRIDGNRNEGNTCQSRIRVHWRPFVVDGLNSHCFCTIAAAAGVGGWQPFGATQGGIGGVAATLRGDGFWPCGSRIWHEDEEAAIGDVMADRVSPCQGSERFWRMALPGRCPSLTSCPPLGRRAPQWRLPRLFKPGPGRRDPPSGHRRGSEKGFLVRFVGLPWGRWDGKHGMAAKRHKRAQKTERTKSGGHRSRVGRRSSMERRAHTGRTVVRTEAETVAEGQVVMQTFQVRRGTPGTEPSVVSPPGTLARQRWAGRWKPFGLGVGRARFGAAVPRGMGRMDPAEDRAMFLYDCGGGRGGRMAAFRRDPGRHRRSCGNAQGGRLLGMRLSDLARR